MSYNSAHISTFDESKIYNTSHNEKMTQISNILNEILRKTKHIENTEIGEPRAHLLVLSVTSARGKIKPSDLLYI